MAFWLPVGLVVVILAGFNLLARRRQPELLKRLRAEWGRPTERARDLSEIAHHHRVFAADRESRSMRVQGRSWNAIALLEVCGAPPRLVERALARTAGLAEQRRLGGTEPADE